MPLVTRTHQALLNAMFGNTSSFGALATAPTVYVGLSTTTPTMAGANVTEPSGDGYARVATAGSDWDDATNADPSVLDNTNAVTFPTVGAAGDWGTVTHFVLFDASSGGNVLAYGALGTPKNPTDGDTPSFPAGSLQVNIGS
jgi:hypothetical protein